MTWWWIIGGIGALITFAAGMEAWAKRNRHRPLSHLSQERRRYDDSNAPKTDDKDYELDVKTYMNSCNAISGRSWKVAKDPAGYAMAMMPDKAKGQTK
jgi:hypothetical protein